VGLGLLDDAVCACVDMMTVPVMAVAESESALTSIGDMDVLVAIFILTDVTVLAAESNVEFDSGVDELELN
jgi:hypothetical protein